MGSELKIDTIYGEIAGHIKATDDTSVKVLGLVPLASGATVLGLLLERKVANSPMVFLISAFSALVVFGFFRWELRNIQVCSWLYARACELDGSRRPKPPGGFGKTQAECLIYTASIGLWLMLPWLLLLVPLSALDDTANAVPRSVQSVIGALHLAFSAWIVIAIRKGIKDIQEALQKTREMYLRMGESLTAASARAAGSETQ